MEIIKATDISQNSYTYLIYGNQGIGKTSSLKYLPGKTLVIDVDKSSAVLAGEENIDITTIDTSDAWASWNKLASEIIENKKQIEETYDNLVLDNVTELFRANLENLGKLGKNQGVPSMADYQKVDFLIMRAIRVLKSMNIRLVFTAWEKTDEYTSENGQTFNRAFPDLRNGIANNFMGLCDVIARLVVTKRNDERVLGFILQPQADVMAKNRLDNRAGCLVDELFVKKRDKNNGNV